MLWDIIRDFIVEHITGGVNSGGRNFYVSGGQLLAYIQEDDIYEPLSTANNDFVYKVSTGEYIGFNDWLATTLTVICMCLIVAFAIWLVRWVFKAVSSAFLLRR